MTFYHALTPYYDVLFPANEKQLRYISSYYAEGSSLLDMGAGTGNIAYALAEAGYNVTAAEPEVAMCAHIRAKAEQCARLTAISTSMLELDQLTDHYDGIYCVGNTLAHLQDRKEICKFLQQAHGKLRAHGTLIIQVVNYDNVLAGSNFTFPVIRNEQVSFARSYELVDDKVLFTSTVTANGQAVSSSIPLFPVTYNQLVRMLEQCGFCRIEAYRNFEKAPYASDASALILAAHK